MSVKSRKEERSEATRAVLVATAERMFAARGYAATATEEIVAAAGVTRGALYHHFADKRDLFRAVFIALEERLTASVAEHAAAAPDAWSSLAAGTHAFLDGCLQPEVQRIVLVDAPSVLGWAEWREIDERFGLGLVRMALQHAMEAGAMPRQPVEALSHLLLGALNEAALFIARADDRESARREVGDSIDRLLDGMRAPQPSPPR